MKHPTRSPLAASIAGAVLFVFPVLADELGQVRFSFDEEERSWFTMTYEVGGTIDTRIGRRE